MKTTFNKEISKIASKNNTTKSDVMREMNDAIALARSNEDEKIQAFWRNFPGKHEIPTAEEVIAYFADTIRQELLNSKKALLS